MEKRLTKNCISRIHERFGSRNSIITTSRTTYEQEINYATGEVTRTVKKQGWSLTGLTKKAIKEARLLKALEMKSNNPNAQEEYNTYQRRLEKLKIIRKFEEKGFIPWHLRTETAPT